MPANSFGLRSGIFGLALVFLLGACAGNANSPADELQDSGMDRARAWLAEDGRVITVRIESGQPGQSVRVQDSKAGEGFGKGVLAGAGIGALTPLYLFGPFGILILPATTLGGAVIGGGVGAAAGATKTDISYQSLDQMEGGLAFLEAVRENADLIQLLQEEIERQSNTLSRHGFRIAAAREEFNSKGTYLIVKIHRYGFSGKAVDNPNLRLQLAGVSHFESYEADGRYACDWSYESDTRTITEWSHDEAAPYREELKKAFKAIASQVLAHTGKNAFETCKPAHAYSPPKRHRRTAEPDEACTLSFDEAKELEPDEQARFSQICTSLDRSHAGRYLCLSAHGGIRGSQLRLAGHYRYGIPPLQTDLVQAYKWYRLAAGDAEKSTHHLETTARLLSSEDLAQAEGLAANWHADVEECAGLEFGPVEVRIASNDPKLSSAETAQGGDAESLEAESYLVSSLKSDAAVAETLEETSLPGPCEGPCDGTWVLELQVEEFLQKGFRKKIQVIDGVFITSHTWGSANELHLVGRIDDEGILQGSGTIKARTGVVPWEGDRSFSFSVAHDGKGFKTHFPAQGRNADEKVELAIWRP